MDSVGGITTCPIGIRGEWPGLETPTQTTEGSMKTCRFCGEEHNWKNHDICCHCWDLYVLVIRNPTLVKKMLASMEK